jgi:flagellar P-ring protein FlgI
MGVASLRFVAIVLLAATAAAALASPGVRIKELVRIDGAQDNPLAGYGLVVGLAGTGDSSRSRATSQSIANALQRFGVYVDDSQLASRNTASVIVTASLTGYANVGDKLDVTVASLGDARSLVGGTLLMTPLVGANDKVYALAQGAVSVGGFRYDAFGNLTQKNHPTVGMISGGGLVETPVMNAIVTRGGALHLLLHSADFTTADRIAQALGQEFGRERMGRDITAEGPDRVVFRLNEAERGHYVDVVRRIESLTVQPDEAARVIVNERTGTVVSGGDVRIGQVSVTHGELKIAVVTDFVVSQPSLLVHPGDNIQTAVVPSTSVKVDEAGSKTVALPSGTTVADLALSLNKIKASPRDVITILQAIQRAGALHAELVVQ